MKRIIVIIGIILLSCSIFSCQTRKKCAAYGHYSYIETVEADQSQS